MEFEAEVLPGLKPFAQDELASRFTEIAILPGDEPDALRFHSDAPPRDLLALRTVVAVYRLLHFDVPRPRALLGHEHLTRLLGAIEEARALAPPRAFRTFRFSAAGHDSAVFARLQDEIGVQTGLAYAPDEADLLLRVRPAAGRPGWEVLVRLSPRPLSARGWRACDMPGALNATIAAAMVELTRPTLRDRFFNPLCGSGTLLIERLARRPAALALGCDLDEEALACAQENLIAAGFARMVTLKRADATELDAPDASFDAICADLPWGQLSGSPDEIEALYPAALSEWARVAAPGARLVLITHAVSLFESLLDGFSDRWALREVVRVFQGGLHPRIYAFERTGG